MIDMKKLVRFLLFFVPLALLVWWLFVPHQREEKDAAATNNLAQMIYRDVFAGVDYNPDVPPFAEQLVDESQYLQLCGEAIARMRGVPYDLHYDARSLALNQMMQEEAVSPFASQAWQFVGPAPLPNGQTTGTPTPVSGRTIAIAVHPTNPDIVYVGTSPSIHLALVQPKQLQPATITFPQAEFTIGQVQEYTWIPYQMQRHATVLLHLTSP